MVQSSTCSTWKMSVCAEKWHHNAKYEWNVNKIGKLREGRSVDYIYNIDTFNVSILYYYHFKYHLYKLSSKLIHNFSCLEPKDSFPVSSIRMGLYRFITAFYSNIFIFLLYRVIMIRGIYIINVLGLFLLICCISRLCPTSNSFVLLHLIGLAIWMIRYIYIINVLGLFCSFVAFLDFTLPQILSSSVAESA